MTLLGDILLGYYAGATDYADKAVIAAVEELERHADQHPELVVKVEMAMILGRTAGRPGWEQTR